MITFPITVEKFISYQERLVGRAWMIEAWRQGKEAAQ